MIYGTDRSSLRRYYRESWRKACNGETLQPLEQQIAAVIGEHPEYQPLLEGGDDAMQRDYFPEQGESNPFLHMGMHLALREQLATGRPVGIRATWQELHGKLGDAHEAEHRMMECLAQALWEAQRNGSPPDEAGYLYCLKRLT